MNLDVPPARRSGGRLLVLTIFITLIFAYATLWLQIWKPGDGTRRAGTFQDVQVATGSGPVTFQITVSGFRAGSTADLSGFNIPAEHQEKTPHFVWFTVKSMSGNYSAKDPFPIAADQWHAISSDGNTLRGVLLRGELQPCPHVDTALVAAGESSEGCFMVLLETGHHLTQASLNPGGGETRAWTF